MEKKKYRVIFKIVVEVEAEDEEQAVDLADTEWAEGNFILYPYIEEI